MIDYLVGEKKKKTESRHTYMDTNKHLRRHANSCKKRKRKTFAETKVCHRQLTRTRHSQTQKSGN